MSLEWGTVGEWVSGGGALAAVAATIFYSRRAEKARVGEEKVRDQQYRDEVKRHEAESARQQEQYADEVLRREQAETELREIRERDELDRIWKQAHQVAFWSGPQTAVGEQPWVFIVKNASAQVVVVTQIDWDKLEPQNLEEAARRTGVPVRLVSEPKRRVVPPGETVEFSTPPAAMFVAALQVHLTFRDASGRTFIRRDDGELLLGR